MGRMLPASRKVAAVYRDSRWWLCDGQFDGKRLFGTGLYELLTR